MNDSTDECGATLHVAREHGVIWLSGTVRDNRPHRHHALQLVWAAPSTEVSLELESGRLVGSGFAIDHNLIHRVELPSGLICLVDSGSELARRLRGSLSLVAGCAPLEIQWSGDPDDADAMLTAVAGADTPGPVDPRIRQVLDWLDAAEGEGRWSEVDLEGALKRVHLSKSRFLHLFSAQVGSPWRTYLVWRRALVAMNRAQSGMSLTDAAHGAGYADSAHLSRQFVALFGITPSAVAKNSHFVQGGMGRRL